MRNPTGHSCAEQRVGAPGGPLFQGCSTPARISNIFDLRVDVRRTVQLSHVPQALLGNRGLRDGGVGSVLI